MKEEVTSKLESKISEQNDEFYELESRDVIQEEAINNLLTKCDNNEQCSRLSCFQFMVLKVTATKNRKM